jgi:hypothetical protein
MPVALCPRMRDSEPSPYCGAEPPTLQRPREGGANGAIRNVNRILILRLSTASSMPGDTMVLFGRGSALQEIDHRRQNGHGDREHEEAVVEHQQMVAGEEKSDTVTSTGS